MDRKEKRNIAMAVILTIIADGYYCLQIIRGDIAPPLATWVVCGVAATLALFSYRSQNEGEHSIVTSFGNHLDLVIVWAIVGVILIAPKSDRSVNKFDLMSLCVGAGIAIAWAVVKFATGSGKRAAIVANILSNGLLVVGYGPTCYRLVSRGRNTDSFVMWGISLVIASLFIVAPIRHKDTWQIVYFGRALVSIVVVLVLMTYFQFFGPR